MEKTNKMDILSEKILEIITIIAVVIVAPMALIVATKAYFGTQLILGRDIFSDILFICLIIISILSYSMVFGYVVTWVKNKIKR